MKSIPEIHGIIAPVPPAPASAPGPAERSPAPLAAFEPTSQPSREELEAAAAALQARLDELPGGDREVRLLYAAEDHVLVVEVRHRDTGQLLQRFPPEILLNQDRQAADLLGTVIDRRS